MATLTDLPSSEGFAVDATAGSIRCGYCTRNVAWRGETGASLAKGYLTLTGWIALALDPDGAVVVVAEAKPVGGTEIWLPHACPSIPADVVAEALAEVTS